jgi:hypothetical protein
MNRTEMRGYIALRIPEISRTYSEDRESRLREWEFLNAVQQLLIETDVGQKLLNSCVHKKPNRTECTILDGVYCAKEGRCPFHDTAESWEEKQKIYPIQKDYKGG